MRGLFPYLESLLFGSPTTEHRCRFTTPVAISVDEANRETTVLFKCVECPERAHDSFDGIYTLEDFKD